MSGPEVVAPQVTTAGDSARIAAWTLVSRVTGVLRVAAIGAVLGPTALGNTFQFTNSLPNLVYYGFLAGSLFSSLLVPRLVPSLDRGDRAAAERVAGGFLGVALAALVVAAGLAVLAGPFLLRLGAMGTHAEILAATQERAARLLLLLLIPQVLLYLVVGCSTAVQNARHRFALAAAAPALENVGIIAVLGILAVLHPQVPPLQDVPTSVLVILGVGATGAVALHAAVQWWGARRAGVTLRPRAGWRDPEVLALVRRALPALGLAGLAAVQLLTVLVLANRVPGGVVAVQLGLTFYFFVVAIAATPIGLSVLPRLSRLHAAGDPAAFRATWTRGVALALFLTVPAAVGYVVLARPLARVVAVGHMGTADGIALVAVTLMAFAPGVVGEGLFQVLTYVFYARHDSRTPMWSMGVQVGSFLVLACGALLVEGGAVPLVLGLAFSTANTIGVCHLGVRLLRGDTGPLGQLGPTVWRTLTATAVMAVPAWGLSVLIPRLVGGAAGRWLSVGTAVAAGVVVYVGLQAWWRAPELAEVLGSRGAGPGPARPVTRRLSPARRAARRAAR